MTIGPVQITNGVISTGPRHCSWIAELQLVTSTKSALNRQTLSFSRQARANHKTIKIMSIRPKVSRPRNKRNETFAMYPLKWAIAPPTLNGKLTFHHYICYWTLSHLSADLKKKIFRTKVKLNNSRNRYYRNNRSPETWLVNFTSIRLDLLCLFFFGFCVFIFIYGL